MSQMAPQTKVRPEQRSNGRGSTPSRHDDADRPLRRSLRGKILVRALLIALVPLIVIGSITLGSLLGLSRTADSVLSSEREELGNEVAGRRLRTEALAVSQELDGFLHERVSDVTGWASDPTITDAAASAAEQSQSYAATGNDQLETDFDDTKMIGGHSAARAFLQERRRREKGFSSLFFTERNGFVVTSTDEPDDFVKRDEDWWQAAQIRGLHFGAIDYNANGDFYSLPISARVQNPANGEGFGGVLQARLGVNLIQQVARRNAGREGRQVTVLTPAGELLAETSSKNDPGRIMQPDVTFEGERRDAVEQVLKSGQPGFIVQNDTVVGFASLRDVRNRSGGTAQDINAFRGIDPAPIDWIVMVEQPADLAFAQLQGLSTVRTDLNSTATRLAVIGILALLLAIAAATVVSGRLSRRIVAPLQSLRRSAYEVADRQLPQLVAHVQSGDPDAKPPAVPAVRVSTNDEVEDVAEAFNVVRDTAVDLAADQARSRRNVATMFVNLGRRNQGLLSRQLEFIDTLERGESDPELLDNLFRLDHLATRMRRNAESLLVLAGEEPPRRWTEPVPLEDVVRGAVAEVEDYQRVDVEGVTDIMVDGQAASDIAHLLAELVENATNFSPPDTPVSVVGRWVANGYALSVVDDGIGMRPEALAEANERLVASPSLDRVPSSYLGLFVVGRLAARYGIEVRLLESMAEGVIAKVVLPAALVEAPGRPSEAPSPRALEAGARDDGVTVSRRTGRPGHDEQTTAGSLWAVDERARGGDQSAPPDEFTRPDEPTRRAAPVGSGEAAPPDEPARYDEAARVDESGRYDEAARVDESGRYDEPARFEPVRPDGPVRPDQRRTPQPDGPVPAAAAPDGRSPDGGSGPPGEPAQLRRRVSKRSDEVAEEEPAASNGTDDDTAPVAPLRLDTRRQVEAGQDDSEPSEDTGPLEPVAADDEPVDPHRAHRAASRAGDRLGRFQRGVLKGRSDVSAGRGTRPDSES